MKRLLTSSLLVTGTLIAVHLVDKRQTPAAFIQETSHKIRVKMAQYRAVTHQCHVTRENLTALSKELAQSNATVNAIKNDVARFRFKLEPRLEAMQQVIDDFKTDRYQS